MNSFDLLVVPVLAFAVTFAVVAGALTILARIRTRREQKRLIRSVIDRRGL